jgi:hypothetical protein
VDVLEELIKHEIFTEYRHLRNYVLFRESCINSNKEEVKVKMPEEITRKYIKTYEGLLELFLESEYKNYKQIIQSKQEEVIFSSKRWDGIRVKLLCNADTIGLYLGAEPYPHLQKQYNEILKQEIIGVAHPEPDGSSYMISTMLDEYNAPKTHFLLGIGLTKEGTIISDLSTKIPDMIGEKIDGYQQTLGMPIFPKGK